MCCKMRPVGCGPAVDLGSGGTAVGVYCGGLCTHWFEIFGLLFSYAQGYAHVGV
jgi:hypothetical protein